MMLMEDQDNHNFLYLKQNKLKMKIKLGIENNMNSSIKSEFLNLFECYYKFSLNMP